ncbi:MAG: hypothetical protein R3183_02040 [Oleiphilaceae bacterium]|nr:hypothetical protein [Oleiphilaceae bacterium]
MGEGLAAWYKNNGEYILGGLFGLVVLDLFMFLVHCLVERTTEGYGLTTLIISIGFLMVAYFEKLYSEQEAH